MPADPSIYNALMAPQKSALDYANQFEDQAFQREQRGTQRQMNALQLQQATQAQADDQAYRDAAKGFGTDSNANANALLQRGLVKQAMQYRKDALDSAKTQSDITLNASKAKEQEANAAKAAFETEQARRQKHLQELVGVNDVPSALSWLDAAQASGELKPESVAAVKQQLQANPQSLADWKTKAIAGGYTLQQQRENEWKKREFDAAQAKDAESARHNKATEGLTARGQDIAASTTRRGQDMTDARTREQLAQNPKQNSQAAKTQDAQEALQLIGDAEKILDSATGSYIGAGLDAAAQGVGISTKGAQGAARLKAIEGMLVSKMPKMSGPQSDKDVALYRQMAGMIGDPTVPSKTKRAALESIKEIQRRYAGDAGPAPATASAAPSQPRVVDFSQLK